ncbi:MAG: TlpA family protein disulfide reductase [Campylobacterales bacterium]|nr:TlpA family protein disulfide reductase [Campylobacterales bacterium]
MKKIKIGFLLFAVLFGCKEGSSQKIAKQKTKLSIQKKIDFSPYTFKTTTKTSEKLVLEKGKKYLLDFWYLECAPCIKDHKKLAKKITDFRKNNIELIGFSIDRNTTKWRAYLKEHKYFWKNYNQFKEKPNLKKDLKISLFPRYYLIDGKGNIEFEENQLSKVLEHIKKNK